MSVLRLRILGVLVLVFISYTTAFSASSLRPSPNDSYMKGRGALYVEVPYTSNHSSKPIREFDAATYPLINGFGAYIDDCALKIEYIGRTSLTFAGDPIPGDQGIVIDARDFNDRNSDRCNKFVGGLVYVASYRGQMLFGLEKIFSDAKYKFKAPLSFMGSDNSNTQLSTRDHRWMFLPSTGRFDKYKDSDQISSSELMKILLLLGIIVSADQINRNNAPSCIPHFTLDCAHR